MATAITDPIADQLRNEQLISLAAAARMVPPSRRGRPTSPSTLLRWVQDGVACSDGQRVYLDAFRLGGRWVTSIEALARFAGRQTPGREVRCAE